MTFLKKNAALINVIARVFIALIGGFLLANLVAISLSFLSPNNKVDAILACMMMSFIVYAIVVMFVFSTKTARSAALWVFSLCLVVFSIIFFINTVYT